MHKRHRRVMAPAFGPVEAKGLLPYFMDSAAKVRRSRSHLMMRADLGPFNQMVDRWDEIIENGKSGYSAVVDVNMWFGKAVLDACVWTSASAVCRPWTNGEPISKGSVREPSSTISVP